MEYKTSVNKVHGSFNTGSSLSAWASPRNNPLFVDENYSSVFITKTSLKVDPRYRDWETDRKSTRLNSSHSGESRMPSSA